MMEGNKTQGGYANLKEFLTLSLRVKFTEYSTSAYSTLPLLSRANLVPR